MGQKYFGDLGGWFDHLDNTSRALVSAIIVVVGLFAVPQTRKYAPWFGVLILVVWFLKYMKKQKGP